MASLLDRLFRSERPLLGMSGTFLTAAEVTAWTYRHRQTEILHLVLVIVRLRDVSDALAKRGVLTADVLAVLGELLAELPTRAEDEDLRPLLAPDLSALWKSATAPRRDDAGAASRVLEETALQLPRELTFLKKPLLAAAAEVAPIFDRSLTAASQEGGLSLSAWEPTLAGVVGLMQKQTDERWKSWSIRPIHLFLAVLTAKVFHDAFVARGVDIRTLLGDLGRAIAAMNESLGLTALRARERPASLVPSISPALFAVLLRAERYAAEDASEVRLRHLLASLHDEPELAPFVARLTA